MLSRLVFPRSRSFTSLVAFLLLGRLAAAQAIEPIDPAPDRAADFYVDVYPVLEAKCLACHSRTTKESDLVLEDVASILKGGASGPAVVPHQPEESLLFHVCSRVDESAMPPLPNRVGAAAVTPGELGRLKRWIAEGAKPGKLNPSAAAIGWQALPSSMKASFALALGPHDRFLAVGRANVIAICDLVTGQEVATLGDPLIRTVKTPALLPLYDRDVAHFDVVSSLAFSPDGHTIASGAYREIKIWQRDRNAIASRLAIGGEPKSASVNSDGTRLLTLRADGTVTLWDLETGEPSTTLGKVDGAAQLLLIGDGSRALIAGAAGQLGLWSTTEKRALLTWSADPPVTALAAATAGDRILTGHEDGSVRRWDIPAELPGKLEQPAASFAAAGAPVQVISMKSDSSAMTVAFQGGKVITLDASLKPGKEELRHPSSPAVLALAMDSLLGVTLPESRRSVEVRRDAKAPEISLPAAPELARKARQLEDDRTIALTRKGQADEAASAAQKESDERAAALEAARKALAAASEALPKAETAAAEKEAAIQKAKDELAARPEDEALKKAVTEAEAAAKKPREERTAAREAVTTAERNVRFAESAVDAARAELARRRTTLESRTALFDQVEKELASARESITRSDTQIVAATLSSDSKFIATGHSDGQIHLWAADDGRWLESFSGHDQAVQSVEFASGGTLVSLDDSGSVIVWNLAPRWKLAAVLGTPIDNRLDVSASPLKDRVLTLDFSSDGRLLASGGGEPSRGGEVLIWDVAAGTVQREFTDRHSDTVNTLAFSRDGSLIATGSADKFVKLSEVETGKFIRGFEGHTAHVLGLDWSADATTLSSGGADGALKIWNAETGEQKKSVQATPGQVTAVANVGLSEHVAIATNKGLCQLYDRATAKAARSFSGATGYVYQIAVTADGKALIAADETGTARVWKAADAALLQVFKP